MDLDENVTWDVSCVLQPAETFLCPWRYLWLMAAQTPAAAAASGLSRHQIRIIGLMKWNKSPHVWHCADLQPAEALNFLFGFLLLVHNLRWEPAHFTAKKGISSAVTEFTSSFTLTMSFLRYCVCSRCDRSPLQSVVPDALCFPHWSCLLQQSFTAGDHVSRCLFFSDDCWHWPGGGKTSPVICSPTQCFNTSFSTFGWEVTQYFKRNAAWETVFPPPKIHSGWMTARHRIYLMLFPKIEN